MINQICNLFFASLNSSIFFLILLIFKHKILQHVGARWYYYLWFTLFIPWISIWLPLDFSMTNSSLIHISSLIKYINSFVFDFFMRYQYSPIKIVIYFWLTGALLALLYISYSHIQFILKLQKNSTPLTLNQQKIIKASLKNKNLNLNLIPLSRIYLTPLLSSPMICHVINSRIYLPDNFFSHYNASEKSYVLHHECIHFQRCDLLTNTGMIILLCLNWFNPLLLYSYKYFRSAQELSCDALLSQQYSMFDSKAYSYALLKTAVSQSLQSSFSCPWNSGSQLKERCLAMKLHQTNPIKNLVGTVLLTISSGIALAAPSLENHMFFEDLRISNFSNNKFTVIANFNCENKLAEVEKNSVTLISQSRIQQICSKSHRPSCTIEFYQSNNCSGEPFASVGLNLQGAISSIQADNKYNVSGKEYNLLLYGHFIPDSKRNNVARAVITRKYTGG
ncbi:MAG TPA: M56 family metallopeptidase [Gammaproteobacteria bacterium]|nr:M56 family metallopeptidase [Gammaproteobacteria bacterium]